MRTRLRALGEELDAHRKCQQAAHPKLTLTQMYNVLKKFRAGETIQGKDREIYDEGLIGILKDLHDQIDAAVAEAYGWPVSSSDEDILFRLVALNKECAEEEARGHIRWLRPDYQNPEGRHTAKGQQTELDVGPAAKVEKAPWPKTLPDQIGAVREALTDLSEASPEQIARRFLRARTTSVQTLLDSLAALGQAEKGGMRRDPRCDQNKFSVSSGGSIQTRAGISTQLSAKAPATHSRRSKRYTALAGRG